MDSFCFRLLFNPKDSLWRIISGIIGILLLLFATVYVLTGLLACGWLDGFLNGDNCIQELWVDGNPIIFAPDLMTLASSSYTTPTIQLWRINDMKSIHIKHTLQGSSVAFSADGTILAVGLENTVQLWQINDWILLNTWETETGRVMNMIFAPDGATLAVAMLNYQSSASEAPNSKILLWRVADGTLLHVFQVGRTYMPSLTFAPDGSMLASTVENSVQLWRVSDGVLLHTFSDHTNVVEVVTFAPAGSILASGSWDGTVKLWRISDLTLLHTLKGHKGRVLALAFAPNGTFLASGGSDETTRLWLVADGTMLRSLRHGWLGDKWVRSIAFSPNGTILATAERFGPVRFFNTRTLRKNDKDNKGTILPFSGTDDRLHPHKRSNSIDCLYGRSTSTPIGIQAAYLDLQANQSN